VGTGDRLTLFIFTKGRKHPQPTKPTEDTVYTFSTGELADPDSGLGDWTQAIPATDGTGNPIWIIGAMALATSPEDTDTIDVDDWSDPVKWTVDGVSQAGLFLYQRAETAPVTTDIDDPLTYTFATGEFAATDSIGGWSRSATSGTDPLWIIGAVAINTGETDEIARGEWSTPVIMAKDGLDGANSAIVTLYKREAIATTEILTYWCEQNSDHLRNRCR